jgi:hypothetical protein
MIGKENHGSIPAIVIERRLKPLDARTDPETDSTDGKKKKNTKTHKMGRLGKNDTMISCINILEPFH